MLPPPRCVDDARQPGWSEGGERARRRRRVGGILDADAKRVLVVIADDRVLPASRADAAVRVAGK